MMMRSMPPASAHLALMPVPAPPPMIGLPAAICARSRCKHCSRVKKLMKVPQAAKPGNRPVGNHYRSLRHQLSCGHASRQTTMNQSSSIFCLGALDRARMLDRLYRLEKELLQIEDPRDNSGSHWRLLAGSGRPTSHLTTPTGRLPL